MTRSQFRFLMTQMVLSFNFVDLWSHWQGRGHFKCLPSEAGVLCLVLYLAVSSSTLLLLYKYLEVRTLKRKTPDVSSAKTLCRRVISIFSLSGPRKFILKKENKVFFGLRLVRLEKLQNVIHRFCILSTGKLKTNYSLVLVQPKLGKCCVNLEKKSAATSKQTTILTP